jgi:hypothetical protein
VRTAAGRLADDQQARAAADAKDRIGRVRQRRFAQAAGARVTHDALEADALNSGHGL